VYAVRLGGTQKDCMPSLGPPLLWVYWCGEMCWRASQWPSPSPWLAMSTHRSGRSALGKSSLHTPLHWAQDVTAGCAGLPPPPCTPRCLLPPPGGACESREEALYSADAFVCARHIPYFSRLDVHRTVYTIAPTASYTACFQLHRRRCVNFGSSRSAQCCVCIRTYVHATLE
jgi:hypothetical protein